MRGMFSYALMLVVNPILILFYQNCSMLPTPQSVHSPPAFEARVPAGNPDQERLPGSCVRLAGVCAINVE